MIKTFYQEQIINRLAAIFTYGLNEGYSFKSIEEHVIASPLVVSLEDNEYDIEMKIEEVVEDAYGVSLHSQADISIKGLFFAESYIKLFFDTNKSFEYLFLYWPLSSFDGRYGIYHEMDYSSLRRDFYAKTKETSLLKKLAQERQIKLVEITKLTGINENTIDKYAKDDRFLYGASNETIYKLAKLFGVKENIFIQNLAVYLDKSIYLFDKRNEDYRNYLGFYFANFFDGRINEKQFEYDRADSCFKSKDAVKLIVIADVLSNLTLSRLNGLSDSRTYIVIIPSGFFGDESSFDYLKELHALEIMALTQEYVYIIKKGSKKEITNTVNRSLIIRAKEMSAKEQ